MTLPTEIAANGHIGQIRETDIVGEMQSAYLDYAMSVIVARALPDVRDGLKPVHRRILYAMYRDLGLTHDKPHKKSARIVGEVLGKYHPHGDSAVYDAMVRMAQDFSLRYPLIDGQGNFGSIDGDNAAAMRYTEARLAEISNLMVADLEKDTVDWHDNFDNSLLEPDILPATLPNLLVNGASGIAVGMATNIPPHNLREVIDALAYMIDHYDRVDEMGVDELLQFIQGPDFPTGGILYRYRQDTKGEENLDVIAQGYSVGKARLVVQAKAHFEEMSRGRSRIVVTELPYQTNKVSLLERIASLVRDGKLEGITDLRDESDRTGMRIVIELTRNADPKDVLADLFKYTPLQQTFGMQMLALVDGEPRTLSLKRMLHLFIQHRQEIVRRRSEYDLARARERAHILEGLLRALDILDEVIDTIRRSRSVETARNNLVKNFGFTVTQAQAILDMQLRRLAALERRRLQDEYKELQQRIRYLEELLADLGKMLAVIKEELLAIREKYGDERRTQIVDRTKGTLTSTDLLPEQDVWISVSAGGELRRQDVSSLSATTLRQIGKGSEVALLTANTRDFLYLFSKDGRCRRVAVHELPSDGSGRHLAELTDFTRRDEITAAVALPRLEGEEAPPGYLFLVTEQGVVKRVTLADFLAAAASDPTVINVDDKDRLGWVLLTRGNQEVILVTAGGQSIRFNEEDVRSMGLAAGGVGGIKLKKGDRVIHAAVVEPEGELVTVTEMGYAKRTPLDQYSSQGRYGGGIVTHKPTAKTGPLIAALMIAPPVEEQQIVFITARGAARPMAVGDIPQMGRNVQGRQVLPVSAGNPLVAARRVLAPPQLAPVGEDEGGGTPAPHAPASSNGANGRPARGKRAWGKAKPKEEGGSKQSAASGKARQAPNTGKQADTAGEAASDGQEPDGVKPARARRTAGQKKASVRQAASDAASVDEPPSTRKKAPEKGTTGKETTGKKSTRQKSSGKARAGKEKSGKGADDTGAVQPSLLEDAPAPRTRSRRKKVQTVVSVPPAQARKEKKGRKKST
ncbi:MAG: DNA gyrase subunit A [Litorilinea sp.]|nr:MAG: DNA gyrase subunit A [Litorilinea sp.]